MGEVNPKILRQELNIKNLSLMNASNKVADQAAHLCNLIRAFVIRTLQSMILNLASGKKSAFQPISVAEQPLNRFS